ncbi:MAG: hypothetical protein AAGB23_03800 [Pseudomonadota bacterium]
MIKVTKTSAIVLAGAAFSMTAPTLAAEPEQDADYTASQTAEAQTTQAVFAPQDDPEAAERERRVGGHSKTAFVKTYDTNEDGQVSIGEFMVKREQGYARRDADGNGSLTKEEYVGDFFKRMEARQVNFTVENKERQMKAADFRFGFMDTDENEIMTAAEFHASGMRMFKRLDSNEDGYINGQDSADSF